MHSGIQTGEGVEVDDQAIQEDSALRRGLYGLNELTTYLSFDWVPLSDSNVARWAQRGLSALEHRPRRSDYSFADLIGLFVVRNLLDVGLGLGEIRNAESYLRERYGLEHPFLSVELKTDGVDVFYDAAPSIADQLTAANRWGQEVFEPTITRALTGVGYKDGIASYWSPTAGVVLDPTIQFGEPCIEETGLTTRQLATLAQKSDVLPVELAHRYRIPQLSVERALAFERKLLHAA